MLVSEINLSALTNNIRKIKSKANKKFCAVVKADAYGHGVKTVSKAIENYVDEYAVATFSEAMELKNNGISKPIIILGCTDSDVIFDKSVDFFTNNDVVTDIIPTICTKKEIAYMKNKSKSVNIKINSGMNRLGARAEDLESIFCELRVHNIKVHSLFTHFYDCENTESVKIQYDYFINAIKPYSGLYEFSHCCASGAVSLPDKYLMDMIRCGIAMYGYSKMTNPVMSVHTNIMQIFPVKKGEHISYGDFVAPYDMTVAIIRAGYGDGYHRINSSNRYVSINYKLCKVVGVICMDMTVVDVSGMDLNGDERVYLLGEKVSGEMLAASYDSIVYEVLTSFHGRIKRVYTY